MMPENSLSESVPSSFCKVDGRSERKSSNGKFPGTAKYWEQRYSNQGSSGLGSYGIFARLKARFVNNYVRDHGIRSVIDFGAGDGNQLRLLKAPAYVGVDTSPTAIARLRQQFAGDATKAFVLHDERSGNGTGNGRLSADLGLSLDVIYHLVEDAVYENYMHELFQCARGHVIIYSSNREPIWRFSRHVRDRRFSDFIEEHYPEWKLVSRSRNPLAPLSRSDFFVYRRVGEADRRRLA